jgi:hypothetical protein
MDKNTITHHIPKEKEIDFFDQKISIIPFLTTDKQVFLINQYLRDYFTPDAESIIIEKFGTYNYFSAELNLMNYIIQMNTDVDTMNFNNNFYSDSYFWDGITSQIKNYKLFRERLERTVNDVKEELKMEKSIGAVLEKAIDGLQNVLEQFKDLSPEDIEKLQKEGTKLLEKLEESAILTDKKD